MVLMHLLHVSDLKSWKSKKPADLVTIGQKLKLKLQKLMKKQIEFLLLLKL
jgi:ribosomal protein S1